MKKEFTEIVGGTEIRYVIDEATGTYLPDWELPKQRELGRYGRMRAEFLKEIPDCFQFFHKVCSFLKRIYLNIEMYLCLVLLKSRALTRLDFICTQLKYFQALQPHFLSFRDILF